MCNRYLRIKMSWVIPTAHHTVFFFVLKGFTNANFNFVCSFNDMIGIFYGYVLVNVFQ